MIGDVVRSVYYTGRADQDSNHGTNTAFHHHRDSMFYILIHTYLNTDQRKYIDVRNDSDHHKCTERQSAEKEIEFQMTRRLAQWQESGCQSHCNKTA